MEFKQKALETFRNNIKNKLPDITKRDLEIMELAFSSGFNVGLVQDKTKVEQTMALVLLSI